MKITNNLGLPDTVYQAVLNDPYDRGNADISVTQLVGPAQIRRLLIAHDHELTEDASDRLYALMGQIVHGILERAGDDATSIREKRLFGRYGGYVLSGAFDSYIYAEKRLQDYKVSSVWEYIFGLKPERIAQLNVLADLVERNGYPAPEKLEVVMLFRDWQMSRAKREHTYPQKQCAILPAPMWNRAQREQYIQARLVEHFHQQNPCTDDERWYTGDKWAVMKKGRKTAIKLCETEQEARERAEAEKGYVEYRPGVYRRCEDYCPVSSICPQWNNIIGDSHEQ